MYLWLCFAKVLDNIISTCKTIATYKGQKMLSSLLVALSQLIFYFVVSKVVSDNTIHLIILIAISSGVGNYIAFIINDKFKKDDIWQNIVTSTNKDFLLDMCKMLREHKVKYLLIDSYNRGFKKSFTVMAFTKTKYESKLIDKYLEKNKGVKYLRMVDGVEVKGE